MRASDGLRAVLATMQRSNAHLARIEDDAREAIGVAALEDVLEELVGEIRDETQTLTASRRPPPTRSVA